MKILCLCYEDMGGFIGGVRQVLKIAEGLVERGHTVEISAPRISKYKGNLKAGLSYIPLLNYKFFRPLSYNFLAFFCILGKVLRFRPERILVYEIFFSPIPLIISRIFNLPCVVFVNGGIEDFKFRGWLKIVLWYLKFLRPINLASADKIITVTDELKKDISDDYNIPSEKIVVVNNGVDPEEFRPRDRQDCCQSLGLGSAYKYVGFLGGIYSWHGLDNLLKSAPRVIKEFPEAKFIIAGDGPLRESLIELARGINISEYLIFPGKVPFELVPVWMNVFDVAVVFFKPVRKNQGNPIKLYEYLACQRPVITSKVKGYGDFVERLGAGLAVDSDNPREIAEGVIKLLGDDSLRKKISLAGRGVIAGEYSWISSAKAVEKTFEV